MHKEPPFVAPLHTPHSAAVVLIHWLTALLIFGMLCSGLAYSYDLLDKSALTSHQWAGQLLIVLIVLRIFIRLRQPARPPHPGHAAWERGLARINHLALYALLIAFAVTGYVAASGLRDPALLAPISSAFARSDAGETFLIVHFALKWALLAVLGLHIAGALKHWIVDRDGTLSAMWFSKNKG